MSMCKTVTAFMLIMLYKDARRFTRTQSFFSLNILLIFNRGKYQISFLDETRVEKKAGIPI